MITIDLELILIIYASVLSTISIFWNIRQEVRKNRGCLEIDWEKRTQLVLDQFGNRIGKNTPVLIYTITNVGHRLLHFENPLFLLINNLNMNKDDKTNSFRHYNIDKPVNFPKSISSGEAYSQTVDLNYFLEQIKDSTDASSKFRIVTHDTFGKTYKSKKIKVKTLLEFTNMVNATNN